MRVLNFSLDKNILENGSLVQTRLVALAEAIGNTTPALADSGTPFGKGELTVLVSVERDEERKFSPNLTAYGIGGSKVVQFFKMWKVGNTILDDTIPLSPPSKEGERERRIKKERRKPYDLITVQDTYFLALLGYFFSRRFNIPFEIQVHGLEKFYGVRKLIAGFVLRRADKIRVVSERLKRELVSCFNLHVSRFYVLPVYTQITTPNPSLEKEERENNNPPAPFIKGDKESFTFLTVGRLVSVKNICMQIRAFARIAKEFPSARLRIVGDGAEQENLKRKVKNLKVEDKVFFEEKQNDVRRFYQEADAFLLTSDAEGWGVVVAEASAYGLPIIMTDVGLVGEFIKNNENGIVISVGDENALFFAMKRVITDEKLRARLGEAARASFLELPNAEEQIKKQIVQWVSFI